MSDKDYRKNIELLYDKVEMPGGWQFDHVDTLKTIDLYYNSKYKTGAFDSRGFRKFFYNIVKPACDIATKFVDLDTKDIILVPTDAEHELKVWLMQKRLKQWLKEVGFGKLMNEIAFDFPKYGHIVIKKVGRKWKKVSLQNLYLDPTTRALKDSPFIYEQNILSKDEIDSMGWNGDVDELYERGKEESFLIFECYTKNGDKWTREIKADLYTTKNNGKINRSLEAKLNQKEGYVPALTLDTRDVEELPYRELKWEEIPGRWLGFGFVEYLEDNQIATNEAENLERKGLMFTSLKLYQTRDESIGGSNILTDAENGDILKVESEITPVQMEERNLAAFNATRTRWSENTQRKTFSQDIASGDNLPSRTPLGVANLQAGMVVSYFEFKRENMGLFLKELFENDIIPDFQEDNKKEHILTFLGSDEEIDKLDKVITKSIIDNAIAEEAMKTGFFPSVDAVEDARNRLTKSLKGKNNRYLKIQEGLYKNAKYFVDVLITDEQVDIASQNGVLQFALQTIATNPAILQNKTTRTIFFGLLSNKGLSPTSLNLLSENIDTTPVPQAGSMSSPTPIQTGAIVNQ